MYLRWQMLEVADLEASFVPGQRGKLHCYRSGSNRWQAGDQHIVSIVPAQRLDPPPPPPPNSGPFSNAEGCCCLASTRANLL